MNLIWILVGLPAVLVAGTASWIAWRDRRRQHSALDRRFDGDGFRDNVEHGHTGGPF